MTDEELKRIEERCAKEQAVSWAVPPLLAEVRRLRGLLESMDDRNEGMYAYGFRFCPWCSWMNDGPGYTQRGMDGHSPKCPAFTEDGDVR